MISEGPDTEPGGDSATAHREVGAPRGSPTPKAVPRGPAFASPLAGLPHLQSVFPLRQKDRKPQKHQKKGDSQK